MPPKMIASGVLPHSALIFWMALRVVGLRSVAPLLPESVRNIRASLVSSVLLPTVKLPKSWTGAAARASAGVSPATTATELGQAKKP